MATDLAARGGRRPGGDAMGRQAEGVHRSPVTTDVHDIDLSVRRRPVEVVREWVPALGEPAVVVAKTAQWHTRRQTARVFGKQRHEVDDRWGHARANVHPGLRLAKHEWMTVRIDESGDERPAGQVTLLAVASGHRSTLLQRAGPDDPI